MKYLWLLCLCLHGMPSYSQVYKFRVTKFINTHDEGGRNYENDHANLLLVQDMDKQRFSINGDTTIVYDCYKYEGLVNKKVNVKEEFIVYCIDSEGTNCKMHMRIFEKGPYDVLFIIIYPNKQYSLFAKTIK